MYIKYWVREEADYVFIFILLAWPYRGVFSVDRKEQD